MPKTINSYIITFEGDRITESGCLPRVGNRILWEPERGSQEFTMFQMNHNKKRNQRISAILAILLVLAMVIPTLVTMFN